MEDRAFKAREKLEKLDNNRRNENRSNKSIDIFISWNQFLDLKSFLLSKEEHTWQAALDSEPLCISTNAGTVKLHVRTLG